MFFEKTMCAYGRGATGQRKIVEITVNRNMSPERFDRGPGSNFKKEQASSSGEILSHYWGVKLEGSTRSYLQRNKRKGE